MVIRRSCLEAAPRSSQLYEKDRHANAGKRNAGASEKRRKRLWDERKSWLREEHWKIFTTIANWKHRRKWQKQFEVYTRLIWEFHQAGLCYDYYCDQTVTHLEGVGTWVGGKDALEVETLPTFSAYPNKKMQF